MEGELTHDNNQFIYFSLSTNSITILIKDPAANDHPGHFRPPDRTEQGPGDCPFQR